jgi:hypothetical protein
VFCWSIVIRNATQLVLNDEVTQKLYEPRGNGSKTGTLLDVARPLQLGDATIDTKVSPIFG